MSKIRIINGPYRGREKTLGDKPLTIGRDAEAGIQILDRAGSRFHAEVFPVGGMFFVRDLESKNGTHVNDEKITDEELLRERDVIKIGSTELMFESGVALSDDDSSGRISYRDDPDQLSNTIEFRLDELSDITETKDQSTQDHARSLRIIYQIAHLLSEGDGDEAKVLEYLVQSMPAESALIFRRDTLSGKLVPVCVRTAAPSIQPVISRSIVKKTFSENKALHIANAQDDVRFDKTKSVVQKGVRSVLCVPLTVGGQVRGVLYLARGERGQPFDQLDLEMVSAVAVQLGMAQHASEQQRRHRHTLLHTVLALVRAIEARQPQAGSAERCARACIAIAEAMRLGADTRHRLALSGLLYHFVRLHSDARLALEQLEGIDEVDAVLPLVRVAGGMGKPGDDERAAEANVLAAAAAFELRVASNPGIDVQAILDDMRNDPALDHAVTGVLQSCHLDGTLYSAVL